MAASPSLHPGQDLASFRNPAEQSDLAQCFLLLETPGSEPAAPIAGWLHRALSVSRSSRREQGLAASTALAGGSPAPCSGAGSSGGCQGVCRAQGAAWSPGQGSPKSRRTSQPLAGAERMNPLASEEGDLRNTKGRLGQEGEAVFRGRGGSQRGSFHD